MAKRTVNGVVVECVRGDIAAQLGIDVVVNAANAELRSGGGVAGALHRAAGPGLARECRKLAPIRPGQAVITGAHNLPNRYVVHCLGPIYGHDAPAEALLASCYREALSLADGKGAGSIAFPAISTGIFGYPVAPAADVALRAVLAETETLKNIKQIRFVLHGENDHRIHEETLQRLADAL